MKVLAVLAAGVAFCGCTVVGPDYRTPDRAAVKDPAAIQPFLGAASPAVSGVAPVNEWWRLYDDPQLSRLIEQAVAANSNLRVAAANLEAARAALTETKSAGAVHAGVSGGVARDQESGEDHLLDVKVPAENVAAAGVSVSYEVDLVGKLRRAIEASQANAEATEAAMHLARVSLVVGVTRAYAQACSAGRQHLVAERAIDLQAQSLAVTERLYKAGRGVRTDVTRARSQLAQLRSALPGFESQQQAALYSLAMLLGRPPADYPKAVEACRDIPLVARPIPVGDGASLLARRPDVREAESRLAQATARIGVATADLYPTITLGASGGASGLLDDFGRPSTQKFTVGPLISWTIPDRGARARVRESEAASRAALARFDGAVLGALRETETSLSTYTHEIQRNDALRLARDAAARAASETADFYRLGRVTYLADLDAERTLANADAALAASDAQKALDQVDLFQALGGGW
jgi:multidrug efflux system outer membrane protein